MDSIEQAVFTSAETDRSAGYQVVATSPGVSESDARELAVWCPSHNALLDPGPNGMSYNFHPLPSGSYCVSRTAPAGWEYSGRRGARVYTQCLIVSPATLARFANNPFALLRAALAAGALRLHDCVPQQLAPLRLTGRAPAVDTALLARLSANPGPEGLAALVQAALDSPTVAVTGGPPAEHLIAGLINCLPPECRVQYSFSTGLKFSSRRPFRVIALGDDPEELLRVQRVYDATVLDFSNRPPLAKRTTHAPGEGGIRPARAGDSRAQRASPDAAPREGVAANLDASLFSPWAQFIHRVLKCGRTSFLLHGLVRRQGELLPEDLPALGLELLEELDGGEEGRRGEKGTGASSVYEDTLVEHRKCSRPLSPAPAPFAPADDDETAVQWLRQTPWWNQWSGEPHPLSHEEPPLSDGDDPGARRASSKCESFQRPHQAHSRWGSEESPPAAASPASWAAAQSLPPHDVDIVEKLEQLDDLVYGAINGDCAAMDQLKAFWSEVRGKLHGELLSDSQEQYLRYALSTWIESVEPDGVRDPARAVNSLEVLCLLFDRL